MLQAAVAALHAERPTPWPRIAALHAELARVTGSPVVELNRAVAVAEADGPAAGLAIADGLDLPGYRYLHAVRAELLTRLHRPAEARAALVRALELTPDDGPERRLLQRRHDALPDPLPSNAVGNRPI